MIFDVDPRDVADEVRRLLPFAADGREWGSAGAVHDAAVVAALDCRFLSADCRLTPLGQACRDTPGLVDLLLAARDGDPVAMCARVAVAEGGRFYFHRDAPGIVPSSLGLPAARWLEKLGLGRVSLDTDTLGSLSWTDAGRAVVGAARDS